MKNKKENSHYKFYQNEILLYNESIKSMIKKRDLITGVLDFYIEVVDNVSDILKKLDEVILDVTIGKDDGVYSIDISVSGNIDRNFEEIKKLYKDASVVFDEIIIPFKQDKK